MDRHDHVGPNPWPRHPRQADGLPVEPCVSRRPGRVAAGRGNRCDARGVDGPQNPQNHRGTSMAPISARGLRKAHARFVIGQPLTDRTLGANVCSRA